MFCQSGTISKASASKPAFCIETTTAPQKSAAPIFSKTIIKTSGVLSPAIPYFSVHSGGIHPAKHRHFS